MPTLVAIVLAALASVAVAPAAQRRHGAPRSALIFALASLAAIIGACWLLPALTGSPAPLLHAAAWPLPSGALLPLQEGLSGMSARQASGGGAHAGDGFATIVQLHAAALGGHAPTLRSVVALNAVLAACNLCLLVALARAVLLGWLAAALAGALWLATRTSWLAALSEGPGALLTTLTLIAVPLAAALQPGASAGPRVGRTTRAIAAFGLVCTLFALAALRREWLVFAPLAAAAWALRARWPAWAASEAPMLAPTQIPTLHSATARAAAWLDTRGATTRLALAAGVAGLTALSLLAASPWLVALNPLDPGPIYALIDALDALSPLAVTLIAVGLATSARRVDALLVLALGVIVLLKVYHAASHRGDAGELVRYLTGMAGALGLLALAGSVSLARACHGDGGGDASGRRWRRRLLPLLAGLLAVPAPTLALWQRGALDLSDRAHLLRQLLAVGDQQREAQALFELKERHPRCVIATLAFGVDAVAAEAAGALVADRVVALGGPLVEVRDARVTAAAVAADQATLAAAVLAAVDGLTGAPAACVIAFAGRDCSLRPDHPGLCAALPGDADALDERLADRCWYSHVQPTAGVRLRAGWLRRE